MRRKTAQRLIHDLRTRLGEVADIGAAVALLSWDEETYMPPKAAESRGRQRATLAAVAHRMFTAPELGKLLGRLSEATELLEPDDVCLVAEARYDHERAVKLPEDFVHRFAEQQSRAYHVWIGARAEANFKRFEPDLAKLITLVREKADYLGYSGVPYNALLEDYERGMTAEELTPLFRDLAANQKALVARIASSSNTTAAGWLDQDWNEDRQWDFGVRVLRDIGFDFDAGRQDKSVHPFTTNFDICDVRLTTRINTRELFSGLMSSIHEGGHGLYEQGFQPKDRRTPLAQAPSVGLHESQSRMWENLVGRSLPFWKRYVAVLREHFPGQLDGVGPEEVYRAINVVRPSLIRVEADECTYNLHIILRFEIEVALLNGSLAPSDIPAVWNAKVKDYLGIDVPDDAKGCLQDIHWAHGLFGYFPTYALGNLYASQIFDAALREMPGLWSSVEEGDFSPLRQWLRDRVHRAGRRKLAADIVRETTGSAPSAESFLRYLDHKYSRLYGL